MKAPVQIIKQKDGRHAVVDGDGNQLGMHKSIWSAARQIHEYGPGDSEGGESTGGIPDEHPPVPRPARVAPKKDSAPSERPKRIPRP